MKIEKIEILRDTTASGKDVFKGDQLAVPEEISLKDAQTLISMDKARVVEDINPASLFAAIDALDPEDEGLWTEDGKPQVSALSAAAGHKVTAAQRDEAWAFYADDRK